MIVSIFLPFRPAPVDPVPDTFVNDIEDPCQHVISNRDLSDLHHRDASGPRDWDQRQDADEFPDSALDSRTTPRRSGSLCHFLKCITKA